MSEKNTERWSVHVRRLDDLLDELKHAQTSFFEALNVDNVLRDSVVDNREFRWNGDHGVVWWRDAEDRPHEVRFRQFENREGLYLCHGQSAAGRQAWFVFSTDREDGSLKWEDGSLDWG